MGLLDRLGSLFSGQGGDNGVYFYVKCKACGEKIKIRANPGSDFMPEYGEDDKTSGYTLEKDVLGTKCFRMMHLHVQFDSARRIVKTSVDNGALISKEEFLQP
jgi:hypothetical protein